MFSQDDHPKKRGNQLLGVGTSLISSVDALIYKILFDFSQEVQNSAQA